MGFDQIQCSSTCRHAQPLMVKNEEMSMCIFMKEILRYNMLDFTAAFQKFFHDSSYQGRIQDFGKGGSR